MMQGIQFVTNSDGKKTAVMLDLEIYGELWEDIYDVLLAHERENEPRESLEDVKNLLKANGKLDD